MMIITGCHWKDQSELERKLGRCTLEAKNSQRGESEACPNPRPTQMEPSVLILVFSQCSGYRNWSSAEGLRVKFDLAREPV
jgi:hypothetical protein